MGWRMPPPIERFTHVLAGGLMLWLGGWLWRQTDPWRWNGALERTTQQALESRHVPMALRRRSAS